MPAEPIPSALEFVAGVAEHDLPVEPTAAEPTPSASADEPTLAALELAMPAAPIPLAPELVSGAAELDLPAEPAAAGVAAPADRAHHAFRIHDRTAPNPMLYLYTACLEAEPLGTLTFNMEEDGSENLNFRTYFHFLCALLCSGDFIIVLSCDCGCFAA